MRAFFDSLIRFWLTKIYPRIESLIAFLGIAWLGLCLLAIFLFAKLSDNVLEQEAFNFDKTILIWIHQFANPVLDRVMLSFTRLGNPSTVVPLTILVFSILWWRYYQTEAKIFALNCLGGSILNTGLKLAFNKPRPQLWPQLISETTFSYPSGHALGSMVLYGFLGYLLATHMPQYAGAFYSAAGILIIAVGISRLYLGVHWPTDILAGYSVGFLWVLVCITLLRLHRLNRHRSRAKSQN